MRRCDFFFFNDTATTEIYTLSLHDALPISTQERQFQPFQSLRRRCALWSKAAEHQRKGDVQRPWTRERSEEHTSELQSQSNLVCRLLLEKKNARFHRKTPSRSSSTSTPSIS